MRALPLPAPRFFALYAFCVSVLVGAIVVLDPFLTNSIAHYVDIRIAGKHILKLFPYELSTIGLCIVLALPMGRQFIRWIVLQPEKSFIIFLLIGFQTPALTKAGKFDVITVSLFAFFLAVLARATVKQEKIRFAGTDMLNIFLALSIFLSATIGGFFPLASSMLTMSKIFLISFLIVNALRDKDTIVFFLKTIVVITTISSLIALLQELLYVTMHVLIIGDVDRKTIQFLFEKTSFGEVLRVPAFFGTYKPFTFFLNVALMIILNYFLYNRPFPRKRLFLLVFSFFTMFTALMLTFSKDGVIAFCIGFVVSLLIWRPHLIFHLLLLAVAISIAITVLGYWGETYEYFDAEIHWGEQRIRPQLAKDGISGFIFKHPLVGAGPNEAQKYTANYYGWASHNVFIEAADTTGVIGLSIYCILVLYTFFNLIRASVLSRDSYRWISMGLLSGFITYLVSIQFHPAFLEKFTWILIGIIQANAWIIREEKRSPGTLSFPHLYL